MKPHDYPKVDIFCEKTLQHGQNERENSQDTSHTLAKEIKIQANKS
jgi:hypothetical protein